MDVIFYFVVSLLVATVFCYLVFMFKNGMIKDQISKESAKMESVGTQDQKNRETNVMGYQQKIGDFTVLLKNHEFASNVFAFMQAQTMPNIWFSQFSLDEKNSAIQLNGESDNLDAFSRQVAVLEKNKYVKSITSFNSSLGEAARTEFNIGLVLDDSIFGYLPNISADTTTNQPIASTMPDQTASTTQDSQTSQTATATSDATQNSAVNSQLVTGQKLIVSFHLLLDPEVQGVLDQTNFTVTSTVPYGTDVTNLTPAIVTSPGTSINPTSLAPQNFSNPVMYKVISEDGSVQNYQVSVEVAPAPLPPKKPGFPWTTLLVVIGVIAVIIIVVVIVLSRIRNRSKKT